MASRRIREGMLPLVNRLAAGLCLAVVSIIMSGCAKQPTTNHQAAIAGPAPSGFTVPKPVPATSTDDIVLPSDPIADQPPMPVALLSKPPNKQWQAMLVQASVPYPLGDAPLPARGVGFRGSINESPVRQRSSLLFASSTPAWAPVYTVTPDDHLAPDTLAVAQDAVPYSLDAGDQVRIFVYGQPSLSRVYAIDAAGTIAMPLIGAVRVRGLTVSGLQKRISGLLGAKFVRDPQVAVEVSQYRPFFILGEVRNAGQYAWVNGLTVQSAVAIAGGFSPRATERSVRLTRVVQGVQSEIDVPTSTSVRPGDVIYVSERFF